METPQKGGAVADFPPNKIQSPSAEQLSINQVGPSLNLQDANGEQQQLSVSIDNSHQHPGGHSVELGFQDSNLSPALFLLPVKTELGHNFTDLTLLQQSDNDFAPLRAYPDNSTASDTFHSPPQDHTAQASECGSLSQHPLAQATILSEGGTSCCSDTVSWQCLSDKQGKSVPSQLFATTGRQGGDSNGAIPKTPKIQVEPQVQLAGLKPTVEVLDDDTLFLRKDVSAQHLLELLQREVGVPSSSCSAVSSTSEMSVKNTVSSVTQSTHSTVCTPEVKPSQFRRECPAGEASLPHQTQQPKAVSSEVLNITTGSRSTLPDTSSEELHRELLAEAERNRRVEFQSQNQQKSSPPPPPPLGVCFTPYPTKTSMVPFSSGVERLHREQSLWSSGNRTGIDGSYLGFLPQSQSTPGIFLKKPKSNVMAALGKPSAVEYEKEKSHQSKTGISPQDVISEPNFRDTETESQEHEGSSKVQSLPSLNYIQKVDAWRTNQSSSKTSLFDSLALQGFSGISPKKKAYDAVSETLNHLLSEKVKTAPGSSPANQKVTQTLSAVPSGSSCSRRTEAVGSAPSDQDNNGSAVRPTTPPFGRSQSHSSVSTVIMSAHKEREEAQVEDDEGRRTDVSAQPSAPLTLGLFSDVSFDRDLALSSSLDSYKSEVKLGASIGASSVTSLEVDNYAPYWTIKQSSTATQTGPQELNIEERIPLYLHNLGIDQSPSTILTPFAPRGPIREPEFSPTDFCTIKGSIGTPTKSTHPSEADSPHKGEFSRSSILSVGSSISIPISLDSLGPSVPNLDRTRRTSPSTVREPLQSDCRPAATCADSHSDISLPSQQVNSSLISNQKVDQLAQSSDTDPSLTSRTRSEETDFESPLQMSRNLVKSASDSVVSAKTFLKFQKLLSDSQTGTVMSAGSSGASSVSKEDIFLPLRTKGSRFQDSTFSPSSSAAEDPTSQSSLLWARSSSDSMLMSERPRQSSVGRESATSSLQPYFPSTPSLTLASTTHSPVVPPKAACRAEPEGCSAAPPDNTAPPQPQLSQAQLQQLPSTPAEMDAGPAEEENTAQSSSSVPAPEDMDQGGISDASSDSSLAVRVVRLLQRESPSTLMSSTPSTIDQDESKARDWVKPKPPGEQSERRELDVEDKRRIEELKRDLLLKYPTMGQLSTDTEASAPSSIPSDHSSPHALHSGLKRQRSQPVKSTRTHHAESDVHKFQRSESLETQVRRIAAREGVKITRSNTVAPTSISISTCRRSASPSPPASLTPPLSPSPEPLHPNDLSTGPLEDTKDIKRHAQNEDMTTKEATTGSQKRREAVGGPDEEPSPSLQCSNREEEDVHLRSYLLDDEFTISESLISVPNRAEETSLPSSKTRHVSHVHVTLSPKAADQGLTTEVPSSHSTAVSKAPHREFVSPRRSPPTASSPDKDVGLTSPPEWSEIRGPHRPPGLEGAESSTVFRSATTQGRFTSTTKPASTSQRSPDSWTGSAAVPVLLPYKPPGTEDFFYVPQLEADVSSIDNSDTTRESTHPGSDDAVPPDFSSDILGHQDPGLDRGVTIRHTEGIYSKRLKMENYTTRESRHTVSSSTNHESWRRRDEGTSGRDGPRRSPETFLPLRAELDSNSVCRYTGQNSVLQKTDVQQETHADAVEPVQTDLDRLWQRFCDQWVVDVCQQEQNGDSSLLVRLERLSHLIERQRRNAEERGRDADASEQTTGERRRGGGGGGAPRRREEQIPESREGRGVQKMTEGCETSKDKLPLSRPTPEPIEEEEEEEEPAASRTPTLSHSSSRSLHLSAEGGYMSETLTNKSTSLSAFDSDTRPQQRSSSHRDEQVKSSSSLSRLYSAINRQKDGREQRRGRHRTDVPAERSETTRADESSIVADSVDTDHRPPHPGPSRNLTAKRAVRVVSRGIQTAGDLEIVSNGTRRHTRDVGTTFPSPHESRSSSQSLPSSSRGDRRGAGGGAGGGGRSYKHRKSKRSPSKFYPAAVSWFISADDLGSEAKKENQQRPQEAVVDGRRKEEEWMRRVSSAMFFPNGRTHEGREPLRQRQIHEGRNQQSTIMGRHELHRGPRTKRMSSGLIPISLQESLQLRRPEFIFRSMERLKCLALQATERRLQADLTREKEQFYYQTGGGRGTRGGGGAGREGRAPKPAGSVQLRRAVPWKEMIQRSKLIYENLPEVKWKREEERRRAEYRTNRLNAQLYNKRITNRVLGRRTAWQ